MGSSNSFSQNVLELEERQMKYDSFIKTEITNSKSEIDKLTYLIGAQKNDIFDKIDKEEYYQMNKEVNHYYNLMKQKEKINKDLNYLENMKKDSEIVSKDLKGEKKRKQEEIDKLKTKCDLISSQIDSFKKKNDFSAKEKEKETPT